MMMVQTIEIIVLSLLGFFLMYSLFLAIAALVVPVRKTFPAHRMKKLAVVIPAHDEELSIEKSLRSIHNVEYPDELYDIIVIADNCNDRTAAIARNNRALVIERFSKTEKGKGYALQYAFHLLLHSSDAYEGFIVVDADSIISKNFLQVMNWYLEQGCGSIQAADIAAPNPGAWSSEVCRISLTLYNVVRPLGRKAINCSAGLRGNGMCFSAETLRTVSWNAHSLTEDLEYGLMLLQHGIATVFAPEAIVFATMPTQSMNAESQRIRWESGRIPVIKKYAPVLFQSAVKERSWQKVDALIDLVTPAFVNMVALIILISIIKYFFFDTSLLKTDVSTGWWDSLFIISVLYVVVGLIAARADMLLCKAVLYFPLYLVWKIQLYIKLFFTGIANEWVRTTREHSS